MTLSNNSRTRSVRSGLGWLVNTLLVLATVGLLWPWLHMLTTVWTGTSKDAASSCLAFVAALAIAWTRRDRIRPEPTRRTNVSLAALAITVFLYITSVSQSFRVGVSLTAVMILAIVTHLSVGWRSTKSLAVVFALLVMSTPVPGFVQDWITIRLLELLAATSVPLLGLFAGTVVREGFVLTMPAGSVHLVSDCSGLGGILLFVPLAVLLLYVHRPVRLVPGLTAVASAIPLAFLASLARVLITGVLVSGGSSLAGSSLFHEIIGAGLLIVAGFCLLGLCRRAGRAAPREGSRQ